MFVTALLAAALGTAAAPSPKRIHLPDGTTAVTGTEMAQLLRRVPSFSRQTKLACSMCHNGFPQLTAFGRLFKLNGYTMTGLETIDLQKDSASRKQLQLSPIAPISAMVIAGATSVATAPPGKQAFTAQLPQQLSLFAAGEISPRMGIFSQFTYEDQGGTFGIDNVDLRYARQGTMGGKELIYGLTLNNNPTVQDLWNTTPAWGFPFTASAVAPAPAAGAKIDGAFAQGVVGLGAYAMYDGTYYVELAGYGAAPQGAALPLDSSAANTPRGASPYWRVAVQHQWSNNTYLMVGAYGMDAYVYPTGITGPTDHYNDVAFDAQLEQPAGKGVVIGRATYIRESQALGGSFENGVARNATNSLNTVRANVTWQPSLTHSLSAGYFDVSGTADGLLYPSGSFTGSATGLPNTSGFIVDANANPWLNVRLGAQYVNYTRFNGASTSYDVASGGRSAHDNNALYLYLWLAF